MADFCSVAIWLSTGTMLVAFSVIDAYRLYKHTNGNKTTEISVLQFANILGGQLIKSRELISETMRSNQQIILQYRNEEETYTDGNGMVIHFV